MDFITFDSLFTLCRLGWVSSIGNQPFINLPTEREMTTIISMSLVVLRLPYYEIPQFEYE